MGIRVLFKVLIQCKPLIAVLTRVVFLLAVYKVMSGHRELSFEALSAIGVRTDEKIIVGIISC